MSDDQNPEWQEIRRLVDELWEELKSCALAGKAPCGCVFVGIVDKEGRARLFPVIDAIDHL